MVLQNRAINDYLLLRHNHGHGELEGIYCFNISDSFQLAEGKAEDLKCLMEGLKQEDREWLTCLL